MTYKDINKMIARMADSIGCEYAYYSLENANVVKTPYIIFDYPQSNDFFADSQNFVKIETVNIEYDSKSKDLTAESKIEAVLKEQGLTWKKTEDFISDQNVYEIMYTVEVILNV